jgi:hypothetical protein
MKFHRADVAPHSIPLPGGERVRGFGRGYGLNLLLTYLLILDYSFAQAISLLFYGKRLYFL